MVKRETLCWEINGCCPECIRFNMSYLTLRCAKMLFLAYWTLLIEGGYAFNTTCWHKNVPEKNVPVYVLKGNFGKMKMP